MTDVKIDLFLSGKSHEVAGKRLKNWTRLSRKAKSYGYEIVDGRIKRKDGTIVGKIVFNGLNVQVV